MRKGRLWLSVYGVGQVWRAAVTRTPGEAVRWVTVPKARVKVYQGKTPDAAVRAAIRGWKRYRLRARRRPVTCERCGYSWVTRQKRNRWSRTKCPGCNNPFVYSERWKKHLLTTRATEGGGDHGQGQG